MEQPDSEYYADRSRRSGLDNVCKPCRREARRQRWAENHNGQRDKSAANRAGRREEYRLEQFHYRLRRYGLTLATYERLLSQQNGCCALCFQQETKVHHKTNDIMRLTVDHDHECCSDYRVMCGQCVRGLLCYECNLLLGKIEMKPALRLRFADYLARRPFVHVEPASR